MRSHTTNAVRLLAAANSGDREATHGFIEHFDETIQKAARLAFKRLPWDPARHDDVLQGIRVHFLRRDQDGRLKTFAKFDPSRGSLRGFVWQKAFDRARELRTQLTRTTAREEILPTSELSVGFSTHPEDDYAMKEALDILVGMLERGLSPHQWRVFHAKVIRGLSGKEVAAEFGISEDAAHQAYSRANRNAKKIVDQFLRGEIHDDGENP